jgi:protein phosphatase
LLHRSQRVPYETAHRSTASASDAKNEQLTAEPRLIVRAFGATDRGRVRSKNEDQYLIAEVGTLMRVQQSSVLQSGPHAGSIQGRLLVVADGIGGANAGDVASAMLVQGIESFVLNSLMRILRSDEPATEAVALGFQKALRKIEARIVAEANRNRELRGMGTTVTLALSIGSQLFVIQVGDGRCYVFRSGTLQQLTHDQTLVQALVDQGVLSHDEASGHRFRNIITNSVGGTTPGVQATVSRMRLEPGDVLLLCTDGLTGMVSDETIAATLAANSDPQVACQRLVDEANAAGGRDNVTVIVAAYQI